MKELHHHCHCALQFREFLATEILSLTEWLCSHRKGTISRALSPQYISFCTPKHFQISHFFWNRLAQWSAEVQVSIFFFHVGIHGSFSFTAFFLSCGSPWVGGTFLWSLFHVSLPQWWLWRTTGLWIIICGNVVLGTLGFFSLPFYCAFDCHPRGGKKSRGWIF